MNSTDSEQLEPGIKFYYNPPDWARQQSDEIFAPLITVLFEIATGNETATEESILGALNTLGEDDRVKQTVLKLINEHSNDLGEVTYAKEEK